MGDGSTAEGSVVQHTYATEGSFQVTLTVTDGQGQQGSVQQQIQVNPVQP